MDTPITIPSTCHGTAVFQWRGTTYVHSYEKDGDDVALTPILRCPAGGVQMPNADQDEFFNRPPL